jgi:3-phosphoshikimate 1-carboxyvinyltransferase
MNVTINPGKFEGTIRGIASKSMLHRMLFCAACCSGQTVIQYEGLCDDVFATVGAIEALGARVMVGEHVLEVKPPKQLKTIIRRPVDCKESGSTLRFFLPIAAAKTRRVTITGQGRLPERPMDDLLKSLIVNGKQIKTTRLPITMTGEISGREFVVPGNVSSQYLSGLLMMAPLLNDDIIIKCDTKLESEPYVEMTMHVMEQFGVCVEKEGQQYRVAKESGYRSPGEIQVENDWSNAAFFLVANALGQSIEIPYLYENSVQGDRQILDLIAQIQENRSRIIDLSQVPDLAVPLAVLAAATPGLTEMVHGERLRLKESDRIHTIAQLILSLGGKAKETEDGLLIEGTQLRGGAVYSYNDHRIVMAAGIAAGVCKKPVAIIGAEAVNKSYPYFFEELKSIGGILTWEN